MFNMKRSSKLKRREKNDSFIREWAFRKKEELKDSHEASYKTVFAVMMWFVVMFVDTENQHEPKRSSKREMIEIRNSFSGDQAFFEITCYMLFKIDLWLAENFTERREEISEGFFREFQTLFEMPLKLSNLEDISVNRLSGYTELHRQGQNREYIHSQLASLISISRLDQPLNSYDFNTKINAGHDIVEDVILTASIVGWELHMLSVVMELLRQFCEVAFEH